MPGQRELHWTPELVERFWSYQAAASGDDFFTARNGLGLLKRVRPWLDGRRELLDYGCGGGHLLALLLEAGYRAGGVDLAAASVKAADERFAGRDGFLGAWLPEQVVAAGRRFDAVLVVEVIEHLYDDVLDATLERVGALLAPDGVAIFTTPNEEDLATSERYCPSCDRVFHAWQHVRSWSAETVSARLSARGFEVAEAFTTDFGAALLRGNKRRWKTIRKHIRRRLRPGKKLPHLAVVARRAGGG